MAKFLTVPATVIILMALSACGGSNGPALKDVDVQTSQPDSDPAIVRPPAEGVSKLTDVSDPDSTSTTGPPSAGETDRPSDELGTGAPVDVDPTDPILLITLAALERTETVISSVTLVTDPITGDRTALTRDGLYARIDGSLSLADLAAYVNNDVLGDYQNVATFSQSDAVGVVGLATPLADLRTTGDASFEGGASGFVITGNNGIDLTKGRSVVDVVFGVDSVTVTLDQFDGASQISGLVVDSPITEMILNNATITNGGFSGGTLVLRNDSGSLDLTGSGTTTLSQGRFFGLDADGMTPDEVGGIILSEGASGIVYGAFIAD